MTKIAIATVAALAAFTSAASAQRWDNQSGIDQRQANQQQRIEMERRQGDLTKREYIQLQAEQARIREMERRAQADGRVDRREAAQIRGAQNQASRHIQQEANDSQRSWFRRW